MNTSNYNNAIQAQSIVLENDIKKRGFAFGIAHRSNSPSSGESLRKIKASTRMKNGAINRISYKFPRSLIYPHYGAGRGQGGLKGSRWKNKYGQSMRTNPRSLGKAGSGSRQAKPFFDEALKGKEGVPKISEIAAVELAASVTGAIFIDKNNIGK